MECTYRLNLSKEDFILLRELIEAHKNDSKELTELHETIKEPNVILKTSEKKKAVKEATAARTRQAKKKIENAMNLLRFEGKKLTYSSIAKEAQVNFRTVKKYIALD